MQTEETATVQEISAVGLSEWRKPAIWVIFPLDNTEKVKVTYVIEDWIDGIGPS